MPEKVKIFENFRTLLDLCFLLKSLTFHKLQQLCTDFVLVSIDWQRLH